MQNIYTFFPHNYNENYMNTQMEEQNYTVTVCLPYIPPPLNPPYA